MIKSWDDYVDAIGRLPAWQQYSISLRLNDMLTTYAQLSKLSVPYPHDGAKLSIRNQTSHGN